MATPTAEVLQLGDGGATFGIEDVLPGLRGVDHPGGVGEHGHLHPGGLGQPTQLTHVGRIDEPRHDVDLVLVGGPTPRALDLLGEVGGHRGAHVGEADHVRAHIAGGVGVDHVLALRNDLLALGFADDLRNVVTDGLRQAGGVHRDHVGRVGGEDRLQTFQQVGLPAEHRGAFGEGAGRGHHRLLEVPGQVAAVVGAAALRAVAVGQAPMNAEGGVHRSDGLTRLGRVDPQRAALGDLSGSVVEHGGSPLRPASGRPRRGDESPDLRIHHAVDLDVEVDGEKNSS